MQFFSSPNQLARRKIQTARFTHLSALFSPVHHSPQLLLCTPITEHFSQQKRSQKPLHTHLTGVFSALR
jgi:hypothetical protein